MSYLDKVRSYYESSQWVYKYFFYNQRSLGMHIGLWNQSTKTRQQAMLNSNQLIIDSASIKPHHRVLDAGCGVGGTAIYIAKKTKAHVTGITISPLQVKLAQKHALKNKVSHLTNFMVQDFHKTSFPSNTFDVIYGIESICHAYPKTTFLKEARRILKPQGKLVILDGYLDHQPHTPYEKKLIDTFQKSCSVKQLITATDLSQKLRQLGFINAKQINKTSSLKPAADRLALVCAIFYLPAKAMSLIPLSFFQAPLKNFYAAYYWTKATNIGLATYYLHLAQKPAR